MDLPIASVRRRDFEKTLVTSCLVATVESYTHFGAAPRVAAIRRSMIEAETTAVAAMPWCKRCEAAPSERANSARSVWLVDVRVFTGVGCSRSSHNMGARVSFSGARASSSHPGAEARARGGEGARLHLQCRPLLERGGAARTGFARRSFVGFVHETRAARGTCPVRADRQNPRRSLGAAVHPTGERPSANEVAQSCTRSTISHRCRWTKPRAI